jgi:GDP-L-fucose synthase
MSVALSAGTDGTFDLTGKSVWVAGGHGMVGSAVVRRLNREPISRVITATSAQVDLRRQEQTEEFVWEQRPDVAILAAARVGGIQANRSAQADFLYDNLMINANALNACRLAGVQKVVVLGSSCIYPRSAPQPIREEYFLTGRLESTNEGYAIAKIAALELGMMYRRQYGLDVISLMPTNIYGPGDNYDLETSHVFPALIRKTYEAKMNGAARVTLWGTGKARREFLHADDLADAVIFCLINYSADLHLNIGVGRDISILELAHLMAETIGWEGEYVFDDSVPDGTLRKMLNVGRLTELGWKGSISLRDGVARSFQDYSATLNTGSE